LIKYVINSIVGPFQVDAGSGGSMFERVRRWYEGDGKTEVYENDPESSIVFMPHFYTEYHWTARIARRLVGFYRRNWQFVWTTGIALGGLYLAWRAIK
jgi:hypothetical protein